MKILFYLPFFALFSFSVLGQDKVNVKFGKISPADFAPKVYPIDSNANAVVIADVGSSKIVGNTKGRFSLEFKRYRRVHILNKNGFDVATEEIPLYSEGDVEEQLVNLKAVTYNLENGQVVETRLDTKAMFLRTRSTKTWLLKNLRFRILKRVRSSNLNTQ